MRIIQWILIAMCCTLLAACAAQTRKYENRYKGSRIEKPIVVPAGLSSNSVKSYYHVPGEASAQPLRQKVSIVPPPSKD